jgi:hypothetical protein
MLLKKRLGERWNVRDVPCHGGWLLRWVATKLMQEMEAGVELHRFATLVPGRCLEQGLREVLQGYGVLMAGGCWFCKVAGSEHIWRYCKRGGCEEMKARQENAGKHP